MEPMKITAQAESESQSVSAHIRAVPEDPRVARVLEEYLAALEAGEQPDRDQLLGRHADIASALAECLDGLDFIRTAAAQVREPPTVPSPSQDQTLGDQATTGGQGRLFGF